MKRYYFVSYVCKDGWNSVFGDAIVQIASETGVLSAIRKALTDSMPERRDLVILNFKELSEEEYEFLKD